ncbi:MAG: carotenoid oxygenase family protein [Planctomycetes bacterium]|nr:carotenoid oxygenase family protein [Planctomycetota bacterium]
MESPVHATLRSLAAECDVSRLPIEGRLPSWLSGVLLRNGPGRFESAGQEVRHVFDGYALLQRFGFSGEGVSYRSRFLRSGIFQAAQRHGGPRIRQFGTAANRSVIDMVQTLIAPRFPDNAGVHVARLGGRWMALTESPHPVEFDPATLSTIGTFSFPDDIWGETTTAHPHEDSTTGEVINVSTKFSGRDRFYEFYRLRGDDLRRKSICRLPVREPAYLHSFGMSARYLVLAEFPLVLDPLRLLLSDVSYIGAFRWKPKLGTRWRVVDRASGRMVAAFTTDASFAFHHLAAYEEGDDLVVDLAAYADPAIIDSFYFDRLTRDDARFPPSRLERYRFDLARSTSTRESLFPDAMEFASVAPGYAGAPWRFVYAVGSSGDDRRGSFDRLLKGDVRTRSVSAWISAGCSVAEPIFVPAPGRAAEDDGVVLALVHDRSGAGDSLVVLDAIHWGEIARVRLPGSVPYGFHGRFVPEA